MREDLWVNSSFFCGFWERELLENVVLLNLAFSYLSGYIGGGG